MVPFFSRKVGPTGEAADLLFSTRLQLFLVRDCLTQRLLSNRGREGRRTMERRFFERKEGNGEEENW